ncbi:MAG: phosphotransferase family protein [Ktedonobacteraceae bacterium]
MTTLEKLAEVLKARPFPFVICHADLHAANLLRDRHGHVFVIDWAVEPLYAAATFGLLALDMFTTTGLRLNELMQARVSKDCLVRQVTSWDGIPDQRRKTGGSQSPSATPYLCDLRRSGRAGSHRYRC